MKNRRKLIGLVMALFMGVGIGFVPKIVSADVGFGGVLCYSASVADDPHDYVNCLSCKLVKHRRYEGDSGTCYPKPDDANNPN